MLNSFSFKRKIGTLVIVAVVGLCASMVVSFVQLRKSIVEGRRAALVTAVQSARSIAVGYQQMAAKHLLGDAAAQQAAKDALRAVRFGDTGTDYVYVYSKGGMGVMHPIKTEWEGKPLFGKVIDPTGLDVVKAIVEASNTGDGTGFVGMMFPRPGKTEPVPKLQYVASVPGWDWVVGSGVYMDEVDSQVRSALLSGMVTAALLLAAIGTIGWAISRSVLGQIGGDPVDAARAVNQVASGNLAVEVGNAPAGSLLHSLGLMIASLRQTVTNVRQVTDSICVASGEIAGGNHDLSVRTEQTASNLQETAASMEQLTGTVTQTSDSARKARDLASAASAAAADGGAIVEQVISTMRDISDSSKRIEDIIGVIDGIAFQTNILALNAAVEAARAGEQGRGFAVVAEEVRSLARRSAEAAKEIKSLISNSVERVDSGASLVGRAGASMGEIVARVDRVSVIISEITEATTEQSSGIGQINGAVSQLDQMTQQNAALVEQSAAAAESLKAQAQRLTSVVEVFRLAA